MSILGNELRRLRLDKNLSLQEAADEIGVTKQYLSLLENGKRSRISFELAIQITSCFGVTLDYLAKYVEGE